VEEIQKLTDDQILRMPYIGKLFLFRLRQAQPTKKDKMAIRIRTINGVTVALCAAKSEAKEGDIYLDDNAHHALTTKFGLDFYSEGLLSNPLHDEKLIPIMAKEMKGQIW
jgi:hypothetical protein